MNSSKSLVYIKHSKDTSAKCSTRPPNSIIHEDAPLGLVSENTLGNDYRSRVRHEGGIFLDASSHLYKRVCQSVRPSVRPSVRNQLFSKFENEGFFHVFR